MLFSQNIIMIHSDNMQVIPVVAVVVLHIPFQTQLTPRQSTRSGSPESKRDT